MRSAPTFTEISVTRYQMVNVAGVGESVNIYLTRLIEDSVIPLEIGGSGGAIYFQYLVLCNTAWSISKAMSTFKVL